MRQLMQWFTHVFAVTQLYAFDPDTLMRTVTAKLVGRAAEWFQPHVAAGDPVPFKTLEELQRSMTITWVGGQPI